MLQEIWTPIFRNEQTEIILGRSEIDYLH